MQRFPKKKINHSTTNKSRVALKAFFAITSKWKLLPEQERVLLGVSTATYYRWKNLHNCELKQDTLERISYILGIYKALHILLPTEESANSWIHKPNTYPLFQGKSALEKLLLGRVIDLADVRRYLDHQRG